MNDATSNLGLSPDVIKKLVRSASELVAKLDASLVRVKCSRDLFGVELVELRQQLVRLCCKSIATDPLRCRRKAEELLWRKCFYDVICYAKSDFKKRTLTPAEVFYLEGHIDTGVARFSEQLLDITRRLESSSSAPSKPAVFCPLINCTIARPDSRETEETLLDSAQRILVWLGDLSRYRSDLGLISTPVIAQRYYQQALMLNLNNGLPFNQLGTLVSRDPDRGLEAILHYLRSMTAPKVFSGSTANLKGQLEYLSAGKDALVGAFARLITRLLFGHKDDSALETGKMCQATLEMIEARMQTGDNGALLLDVAIVMMLCVDRSSDGPAGQSTAAAAFCCSLFSQILVRLERDLGLAPSIADEESVPDHCDKEANGDADDGRDGEKEEDEDGLRRAKMRRRRVASDSGDECAEEEEDDDDELFASDSISDDSDSDVVDSAPESEPSLQSNDPARMESFPPESRCFLPALKVFAYWFQCNAEMAKVSARSAPNIWSILTRIVNYARCLQQGTEADPYEKAALEEDWKLFGYQPMKAVLDGVDYHRDQPPPSEPALLDAVRIRKILHLTTWLAENVPETGITVAANGVFQYSGDGEASERKESKKDLMRSMAQLWLKSEVQQLEDKLKPAKKVRGGGGGGLRGGAKLHGAELAMNLPYVFIVPDVSALSLYQQFIKRIVKSKKIIVVVPNIVISEMDLLKKESAPVRDCIRWLETCFRTGNRFVRAQRQNEHKPIPLITYPKRKDKSSWNMFKVLECCHHLQGQQHNNSRPDTPIVLLLTGRAKDDNDMQIKGICDSIGVDMKSAEVLLSKKRSNKCSS